TPANKAGLIEQARYGFFRCGARDRLADQLGDRQHPDVARAVDLLGRLDRVGDHKLLELGAGDAGHRAARKYAVGDVTVHGLGALLEQGLGGIHQSAGGIDDVVDQNADPAFDLADHIHYFGLARPLAPLVDDGEGRIDALGETTGAGHAADVR